MKVLNYTFQALFAVAGLLSLLAVALAFWKKGFSFDSARLAGVTVVALYICRELSKISKATALSGIEGEKARKLEKTVLFGMCTVAASMVAVVIWLKAVS